MGVRLYPMTKDPAKLEALCCVPPGTTARLDELLKRPEFTPLPTDDFFERDRKSGDAYDAVSADPDMRALYGFRSNGWGKLHDGAWEALEAWHKSRGEEIDFDAGECSDLKVCAAVLLAQSLKSHLAASYLRRRVDESFPGRDFDATTSAHAAADMATLAEGVCWS